jgi:hypothetical protein
MSEQAKRSIIELRNELKQLKVELSIATDPADIQRLAQAAGAVKDEMTDLNEQINVFAAGSPFELAGKQLGEVKGALANLDFQKAADRAKSLATTVQGISFSTATKGLKDLGTTFMNVGKSLLTNPLFLIAAVIAAIAFAIIELLKQAGIMKVVMDQVGKVMKVVQIAIDAVVQALKDLADWFGITNNAAEDAAEKQSKSAQKVAEAYEEGSKDIIGSLDNQIRMAKLNGEDTEKLERQKLLVIREVAAKRLEASEAELKAAQLSGKLSAEEVKKLQDQVKENKRSYNQAISDVEYFSAQQLKIKEEADKKDKADRAKAYEDGKKKREEKENKRLEAERKHQEDLLFIKRLFEDINLELMADGYEKEELIIKTRLQRQRDAINADNKLSKAEKEDYTNKSLELERKLLEDLKKIREDAEEDKKKREEEQLKKDIERLQFNALTELEQGKFLAQTKLEEDLAILKTYYEGKAEKEDEYKELMLIAEKEFQDKINQLQEEARQKQEAADMKRIDGIVKNIKTGLAAAQSALSYFSAFSDALFAMEEEKYAGNAEEMERINKEKFETNKAFAIGQAIINTAAGVLDALFKGPLPFPFSIPLGAAAAAAGIAQIAAISSQQYRGSGGGGGGSIPKPSGPMTPNFSLTQPGGAMGGAAPTPPIDETSGMAGKPMGGQDFVVKAYVTESDITTSQKKINKYEQLSQL